MNMIILIIAIVIIGIFICINRNEDFTADISIIINFIDDDCIVHALKV